MSIYLFSSLRLCVSAVAILLLLPLALPAKAIEPNYIGAKGCKGCHYVQYLSWQETAMANAFELLKPGVRAKEKLKAGLDPSKDYTHDENCLDCHTTGYGEVGGFVSHESTPDLIGVQCETCHGPGSEYVKIMKRKFSFAHDEIDRLGHVLLRIDGENLPNGDYICLVKCHNSKSPTHNINSMNTFILKDGVWKRGVHRLYGLKFKHW